MKDVEQYIDDELNKKDKKIITLMKCENKHLEITLYDMSGDDDFDYVYKIVINNLTTGDSDYNGFYTKFRAVRFYKKLKRKYEFKEMDLLADAL